MSLDNNLKKHRKRIDLLDDRIMALLNDRAKVAAEIGKIKAKNGEGG